MTPRRQTLRLMMRKSTAHLQSKLRHRTPLSRRLQQLRALTRTCLASVAALRSSLAHSASSAVSDRTVTANRMMGIATTDDREVGNTANANATWI